MSFDTEAYIELFYQDAEEHLQTMTESLLDLEKNPSDKEALGACFRSAHTIKSSSAMVGFMHISEFTHRMEDLIGHLRDNDIEIDTATVTLLFNAFDVLKGMMEQLQDGTSEAGKNETKHRADGLIQQFAAVLSGEVAIVSAADENSSSGKPRVRLDEATRSQIEEARLAGEKIYEITVTFLKEAQMLETRVFLITNNLEQIGSIIQTDPCLEGEGQSIDGAIALLVATEKSESDIRKACDVSEVESIDVVDVSDTEQFEWPDQNHEEPSSEEEAPVAEEASTPAEEIPDKSEKPAEKTDKVVTSFDRRDDRSKTQTVRVSIDKLDRLLNLAAELVIQRGRGFELCNRLVAEQGKGGLAEELLDVVNQQGMFLSQLQEAIMDSRMVPMGMVFTRFRRVVRDLAVARGKEVNLVIEGEETELDKKIIDQIGDPIMHMVRNSVDHGIESAEERKAAGKTGAGTLHLNAVHQGNNIVISVKDDGKGLDAEKLKAKAIEKGILTREEASTMSDREAWHLIFKAGFSTAKEVTDISGRGVGMDVVRRSLEALGGSVEIDSVIGEGTTFYLKLPLTLAIIQALLVESGHETYALPISHISETIRIDHKDIFSVKGQGNVIRLRDQVVPILNLRQVVENPNHVDDNERHYIAVVRQGNQLAGIIVDRMVNEQEIVIKSLGGSVSDAPYISGAAILGNGQVILILDPSALIERSLGSAA